jgi:hypothetical protein
MILYSEYHNLIYQYHIRLWHIEKKFAEFKRFNPLWYSMIVMLGISLAVDIVLMILFYLDVAEKIYK